MTKVSATVPFLRKILFSALFLFFIAGGYTTFAQTGSANQKELKSLRSDVGLIGLTANFRWLNDFHYMGNKNLQPDSNNEIYHPQRAYHLTAGRRGISNPHQFLCR